MTSLKTRALLAATIATGALALSATASMADVACNRYGECWHVQSHYTTYPSALGVIFHDETWWNTNQHDHHYHWRADRTDDHGYWSHGHWHTF